LFLALALSSLLFHPSLPFTTAEPAPTPRPSLSTPTTPKPATNFSIVLHGDSLAAAYGLDPSQGFAALLQKRIDSLSLPFSLVNAGVSGDTTAGGLRRIDWLLKRPIDVLILELGGNDGLRGISPASTRTNLQAIIQKTRARHPQVRIVLAGMQMPPNMGESFARDFREVFPEVAKSHQTALIPFLLENVGGIPGMNLPDLIHPTAKGHELVAENVWKVLEPVLRDILASTPASGSTPSGSPRN
jgi:acyl-CoA thioesterase-1